MTAARRRGGIASAARRPPLPLRDPFVSALRAALFDPARCAVEPGSTVVVGLSGGADSVALAAALAVLGRRSAPGRGVVAIAVHVHHHLRGADADADCAHAEAVAAALGLDFERADIHPARERGNRAAAARRLRRGALDEIAGRRRAPAIALAHHADDQLESVVMALGRGSGLAGLGGMLPRTTVAGCGAALVRPLLRLPKTDCIEFCRRCGLGWREDASNAALDRTRVRIRRAVAPVFESLWPGAASRIAATAEIVVAASAAIERLLPKATRVADELRLDRAALRALPMPLIGMALRSAATDLDGRLADRLPAAIVERGAALVAAPRSGTRLTLARGHELIVERAAVRLRRAAAGAA
ncbi:MAG TPA: tRNA lysidine(34) synthetase TilS [Phycisphaerales bacterium]|nr:tRNA lysidine(34) synthetase TilS [Phycisphaerales bacterium]HMP36950.1 tRNA lysidine(34) synthetase TilS [Phycisphaerales bacterium]